MNSYDYLKFLTVKLTAEKLADTKGQTCTATGFYVVINGAAYIVTAKHFAEETEQKVTIAAHTIQTATQLLLCQLQPMLNGKHPMNLTSHTARLNHLKRNSKK